MGLTLIQKVASIDVGAVVEVKSLLPSRHALAALPSQPVTMTGGFGIWADRLELAHDAARMARRLLSEQDGPLSRPLRLAGWDTWRGAVADHFWQLIGRLDRHHVYPFTDHVSRLETALERLHTEVYYAAQAEKVNLPPPQGIDIDGALRPWREWPAAPVDLLGAGWDRPGAGAVFMDPGAVRSLAGALDDAASEIDKIRRGLGDGLDHVGISPPPLLSSLPRACEAMAGEIRRRAQRMEDAERNIAGRAASLGVATLPGTPGASFFSRAVDAFRQMANALAETKRRADDATIPVAERYQANKDLMRYEISRLEARRAKLAKRIADGEGGLPRGGTARMHDISWAKLECIRIEEKLKRYRVWSSDPSRNFLMFDASGDGRVAEVFGDLEAAKNVAVIVPGMDNEMSNYETRLRLSGDNLQGRAGPETATITWLGYDTPESLDVSLPVAQEIAAGRLKEFMTGISAYGEKNTTVVGHSYGSTVVARAAARLDMPADNLVFVGSPGISNATGDGAPDPTTFEGYNLYYGETRGDFVSKLGNAAHGFGPGAYNARRFHTGSATGHGNYFTRATGSLANMAQITAGTLDTVEWV